MKAPVALMALRGQKVTKMTVAACTTGRTPGCVTVVKLGPEGVDGGRFVAQPVRVATVFEKYWPLSELAFADSGCGGGTPLPIGAGEPVRELEVHVPGKLVDGVEDFSGKWRTTPTVKYTSELEGPSQPGNVHKISLERIFDKLMLDVIVNKLKEEAGILGEGEMGVALPAQTFP